MINKGENQRPLSKQQLMKRLYVDVYNVPEHGNAKDLAYFIWKALEKCSGIKKYSNPILKQQLIQDIKHVRLYFRSEEELLNCLDLHGILYGQRSLYLTSLIKPRTTSGISIPKDIHIRKISKIVKESNQKITIENLPQAQQYEVFALAKNFGQIIAFQTVFLNNKLVRCFIQFQAKQAAEQCLAKLHNSKFKNKNVTVCRSSLSKQSAKNEEKRIKTSNVFESDPHSFYLTFDTVGFFKQMKISCVLLLRNMISSLIDKQKVLNDVHREVGKIGPITRIASKDKNIYVEYERVEYAQICYLLLMNRRYDGRAIDLSFYDPFNFADNILV